MHNLFGYVVAQSPVINNRTQGALMSKITNDCLIRSDTGCFTALPIFVARITFTVLVETLNPAQSINNSERQGVKIAPEMIFRSHTKLSMHHMVQ